MTGTNILIWRMIVPAAALCFAQVTCAQEAAFPSRSAQLVAPYTPSTGADILARILGPRLAER